MPINSALSRFLLVAVSGILFAATNAHSAPGVEVNYTSLTTTEDGQAATYDISLTEQPTDDVTVTPSSSDVTEGTVSGALVFTPANWMESQSVTVTPGASGDGNDGDVMYSITNTVTSPGVDYNGLAAPSVSVTNINFEGISTLIVDKFQNHETDESGTTSTFTVSASGAPSNDVSVDITSNDPDEALLSVGGPISTTVTVTLTAGNGYSVTVTITGQNDAEIDGLQRYSLSIDPSVSGDAAYNGINLADIQGDNADDDELITSVSTYQPDLRIGRKSNVASHEGDNIYSSSPTGTQKVRVKAERRGTASFFVSLQNDGDATDAFILRSQRFHRKREKVRSTFRDSTGTRFSTADLIRGISRSLQSGEVLTVSGKVRVKSEIKRKKAILTPMIRVISGTDSLKSDSCAARLKFKN